MGHSVSSVENIVNLVLGVHAGLTCSKGLAQSKNVLHSGTLDISIYIQTEEWKLPQVKLPKVKILHQPLLSSPTQKLQDSFGR